MVEVEMTVSKRGHGPVCLQKPQILDAVSAQKLECQRESKGDVRNHITEGFTLEGQRKPVESFGRKKI